MKIFFSCFSAGSCFLLSLLLFFHPYNQNPTANKWLSLYVFVMGSSFMSFYLDEIHWGGIQNYTSININCLQLLLGPSIYTSILYYMHPSKKWMGKDVIHFLPFLICIILEDSLLFTIHNFTGNEQPLIDFITRIEFASPFHFLLYISLSYFKLLKHKKNLELISSSKEHTNLDWLRNFLIILSVLVFFWINNLFFQLPFFIQIVPAFYTVSVFIGAYYAIKQKTIFRNSEKELTEISQIIDPPENTSNQKFQRLNEEQVALLSERLKNLMEKDKLFLESELSLSDVAERLGTGIHDTSYLINEVTGSNFYNFVNQYRVKEASNLLESGKAKELNILGIAFESGFNSKTAFNTAFKKWTGLSPTQYINKAKNRLK